MYWVNGNVCGFINMYVVCLFEKLSWVGFEFYIVIGIIDLIGVRVV